MKKALPILLACLMLFALMTACVSDVPSTSSPPSNTQGTDGTPQPLVTPPPAAEVEDDDEMELVNDYWRFKDTRKITVEVMERNADIRSEAHDNFFTDWIKKETLEKMNIEITEFISAPRWEEEPTIANWLAADEAPDVCVTYNFTAIQEYAAMGAVHDLAPLVHENKSRLPNLWTLLGESNIYGGGYNPHTGVINWIESTKTEKGRISTFVREDWLNALSFPEPTTTQEFEDMLVAFRDNAELLLPGQAGQMVPFLMNSDVGWQTNNLLVSFTPDAEVNQRMRYVRGYDDRQSLWPGHKEGVRLLNKWFNDGLIFSEFALYKAGDTPVDDKIKAGYVGSFIGNWNYAYRDGNNSRQVIMQQQVGPEAAFIVVDPFVNDAGKTLKVISGSYDRKLFFPGTNKEPKASIFYLDFLCRLDVVQFLQLGEEGINYDLVDGIPYTKSPIITEKDEDGKDVVGADGKVIILDDSKSRYIINIDQNQDYLLPVSGFYPAGITAFAAATSYIGIEPRYIVRALELALKDGLPGLDLNIGEVYSEAGMSAVLKEKRDTWLCDAVRANPDAFDAAYDRGLNDYLISGGQAIIDEREQLYNTAFGVDSD